MVIDPQHFGRELSTIRSLRSLTQTGLAEVSGLTKNYISLLETGARQPSVDAINSLAEALQVPAQFMTFLGASPPPKSSAFRPLYDETAAAIREALKYESAKS